MWEEAPTSAHSSLSEPNSCSSCHHRHLHHWRCSILLSRRIYLTFALEILDRETRTLRFASAFLLSALLHLIIIHSGLGPLICDVFLPFLALLWNAACALAQPKLAAWNGPESQSFLNTHSLHCMERYSRDKKKKKPALRKIWQNYRRKESGQHKYTHRYKNIPWGHAEKYNFHPNLDSIYNKIAFDRMEAFQPIKICLWFYDFEVMTSSWTVTGVDEVNSGQRHFSSFSSELQNAFLHESYAFLLFALVVKRPLFSNGLNGNVHLFDQTQLDNKCLSLHLKKAIPCPRFVFYPQKTQFLRDHSHNRTSQMVMVMDSVHSWALCLEALALSELMYDLTMCKSAHDCLCRR